MYYFTKRIFLALILFFSVLTGRSQNDKWNHVRSVLKNDWKLQSSAKVQSSANQISSLNFNSRNWYNAQVPGTVLGSLVANGVYKNIFFGRNLQNISDSLFNTPWWYRTTFKIERKASGQVFRLRFNGVNYRADIWLNGHQVASSDTTEGGFLTFTFDVSEFIRQGENVLAVKIFRPGKGDLTVGFVDWNPEPPDQNMGIWRDVELLVSGPVSIDDPYVQSKVDTATLQHAELTVSTFLNNHSDKLIEGTLTGTIGEDIRFSKKVRLNPNETREIIFSPDEYSPLRIDHPRLWWIYTWGKPNLYNLRLSFETLSSVSDTSHLRFGIRQISQYFIGANHRGFKLNGKKILIKGGGWTDPMLLNATPEYEKAGIDYAIQMNLNTIRMEGFWGSNQHIYDLCDEKGILIMVGLSCQWEWTEYLGTPQDKYSAMIAPKQNDIAAASFKDQVKSHRNHPSIFAWFYGSDKWPRPSLEEKYLSILQKFDTTRPSISSAATVMSDITGPSGMKMRGPYDYVPPVYWYVDTLHGGAFGFNTETGPGPQVPVLESLKRMIPEDSLWPIGNAWIYHSARHNFENLTYYNNAITERLGTPQNLNDYLRKAQFLNYEGIRAMFEAFEANRFKATGIIQWMYNASWPKLWWQLYDYYLMPNGAFYGARKANEPFHVSYNYGKHTIEVFNNTLEESNNLTAEIQVLDFGLNTILKSSIPVNGLKERQTTSIFKLPDSLALTRTWFLRLRLFDDHRHLISNNFYVLSTRHDLLDEKKTTWFVTPQTQFADFTMLESLPDVKLEVRNSFAKSRENTLATVRLKNPTDHLAFMIYLDLKKKRSNSSATPVFWDDNYITLLPGEDITVKGYCHTRDLEGEQPEVVVNGWNIK